MGYQPFLISNYGSGIDRSNNPWLIPADAFPDIYDGYVYRGVLSKRDGYTGFAQGDLLGMPTESRMVHAVPFSANEAADGMRDTFTFTILVAEPARRGGYRATSASPAQLVEDNGLGGTLVGSDGSFVGGVTYSPATTPVTVMFNTPPDALSAVTLTVDYHQGLPVMGVMNFYTAANVRQLIVADERYVNRYNGSTDRLDDITVTPLVNTSNKSFFSWVNYPDPDDNNRLLFVNNVNKIQSYNGTTITDYEVDVTRTSYTAEAHGVGTGGTNYTFSLTNPPIARRSLTITAAAQMVTDNGTGMLQGDGTGTIDYTTGAINVTFNAAVPIGTPITASYVGLSDAIMTALQIFQYQDRLIILRPKSNLGVVHPRRIIISGTGIFGDTFTNDATGAGFIDIPANSWIMGATFNRSDLVIYTENSVWLLKYTNNDITPFVLEKIEESRGSFAPFSVITYLNRTMAASARGLIIGDGYRVERMDNNIPFFVVNDIDNSNFDLCFSGFVDEDRDVYFFYPGPGQLQTPVMSTNMLIINFEEDTFAIYRLPMSTMGNFAEAYFIAWRQLDIYSSWDEMVAVGGYATWADFAWGSGVPVAIGGGHEGQIYKLNQSGMEDNPVRIRNITRPDLTTLRVTTDFNTYTDGTAKPPYNYFSTADMIAITGISTGMTQINGKQFFIKALDPDPLQMYYTFDLGIPAETVLSAYDVAGGGVAMRVIPYETTTKQFNPFVEADKKLQMGYAYFYVDTSNTFLTNTASAPIPCVLNVDIIANDKGAVSIPRQVQVTCSQQGGETDTKKWTKTWPNQTGRFIQLRFTNLQAGSNIKIQAIMLGMKPVGRMI